MTVYFHGYEIPDEVYRDMRLEGKTPALCVGCGLLWYLEDRRGNDIHKGVTCPECARKTTYLKRFENKGYHPNADERSQIMKRLARAN